MSSIVLVELCPARTRSSAAALAAATGSSSAPALYLAVIALAVGLALLKVLPETAHRSLAAASADLEPAR